jgi:predicted RNA binding protein YcfA (HicA-like mRNA interferase family)
LEVDSRAILAALNADGWITVRTKGSHVQLRHPTKPGTVTVPHPRKDLPKRTVASIARQAGITLSR